MGTFYDERHIPQRLRRPLSGSGNGSGDSGRTGRTTINFYPDIAVPLELVPSFDTRRQAAGPKHLGGCLHPAEAHRPGFYKGQFTVQESGGTSKKNIPVELTVYNF